MSALGTAGREEEEDEGPASGDWCGSMCEGLMNVEPGVETVVLPGPPAPAAELDGTGGPESWTSSRKGLQKYRAWMTELA